MPSSHNEGAVQLQQQAGRHPAALSPLRAGSGPHRRGLPPRRARRALPHLRPDQLRPQPRPRHAARPRRVQ